MKLSSIICGLLFWSGSLIALSFDEADELYDRRGESTEIVEKATVMYESLLKRGGSEEDKIYAVEQIAKLQSYRAQMIPESKMKDRKPFLQRCLGAMEHITPKKMGEDLVEYLYWQGSCLAQYAEAAGITTSLRKAKEIHDTLVAGRELDRSYHGGGFDRILGAMYSKLPSINPFGPAGDLDLALDTLNDSISSPAHEAEIDPTYGTGNYFYETYYLIAEAWIKKGDKEKARQVIDQAIARIDRGDYSPYRKPETLLAKKRMQDLRP